MKPKLEPETDPIMAVLSVVVPLICGRTVPPEELAYVRLRVNGIPIEILGPILEKLGDTADRVGNPIAAIRGAAREAIRDRDERAEADRMEREIDEARKRRQKTGPPV